MRSGIKTTEFWRSLAVQLIGLCGVFGLFTPEQVTELAGQAGNIVEIAGRLIGAVMVFGSDIGYSISRGKAKSNE